jgi:putative peptidoglycan lipid II flippase
MLKIRLEAGLEKIAFYIIPSVCAFIFLGKYIISAIFQSGKFGNEEAFSVWMVLIGSTVGLLASTLGRLYSSTFYSLKDTKTPLKFAVIRVVLTSVLGYFCALVLPNLLHIDAIWGTTGLTASAGFSGWVEFYLLRKNLNKLIGQTGLKITYQIKLWSCSLVSSFISFTIARSIHFGHMISAVVIFSIYGFSYFAFTYFIEIKESKLFIDKILKKLKLK